MLSCDFKRVVAVALVLTTAVVTTPLTAADFSTARPVIGSVSAVGSVELRGVGISHEGTLFSGDSVRANEKGYAKVLIGTGSKIELREKTDVRFNRDNEGVQLAMNTGMVAFTAHTPLRIDVAPFEVTATDDASGNVMILSATTAGVRALNGKVTVRNVKTSESFVLTKGHEQVLGLKDGVHSPSLGELASNVPEPVPAPKPAPAPQTPAGKTTGGIAMDTGAWLAVIGGAAIGAIAIWALVEAKNNNDDINGLKTQINGLSGQITTLTGTINTNQTANAAAQAALAAQIKAVSVAAAISTTAAQQQAEVGAAGQLVAQAQAALAGNATQLAIANNIAAQVAANSAALATLQAQIQTAQASILAGGSSAQLQTLFTQEENLRNANNALVNSLNALLTNNRLPGSGSIQQVNNAPQSASTPV